LRWRRGLIAYAVSYRRGGKPPAGKGLRIGLGGGKRERGREERDKPAGQTDGLVTTGKGGMALRKKPDGQRKAPRLSQQKKKKRLGVARAKEGRYKTNVLEEKKNGHPWFVEVAARCLRWKLRQDLRGQRLLTHRSNVTVTGFALPETGGAELKLLGNDKEFEGGSYTQESTKSARKH